MDFDPLSFLSAAPTKEVARSTYSSSLTIEPALEPIELQKEERINPDDDAVPLHILDLPSLHQKPPVVVLVTFLRLLSRGEIYNFSSSRKSDKIQDELKIRDITIKDFDSTIEWFQLYCPALASTSSLLESLDNLKNMPEYIPYLTKLISSPLNWIEDEEDRDLILDLASTRISETSSHFLSSEFTRNIILNDFDEIIKLKEPSVTEDNLGLKTWGSSLVLSQMLVTDHKELLMEPIIELGAGTGLVGIICAKLGYSPLMITDLPDIVDNLYDNMNLNNINTKKGELYTNFTVDVLDWSKPEDFEAKYPDIKYNTIILSDPIYSQLHPIWVGNMISKFLTRNQDSRVLLQIPLRERFQDERQLMFEVMEQLQMKEVLSKNEDGVDDFGKQSYLFKMYKWKM